MKNTIVSKSIIFAFGLTAASVTQAAIIEDQLFNTGLNAAGNALSNRGGVDAHWNVDGNDAITYKHRAYARNNSGSKWISVNRRGGNETTTTSTYTYSTTFDLSGYDPLTASITGSWGADNYGTIFLNGQDTGVSLEFGYAAFRNLNDFAIDDLFVDGLNTLSVELTNGYVNRPNLDPGPGALRFDNLELTASKIPEPSSFVIFALGIAGLVASRKRAHKTQP